MRVINLTVNGIVDAAERGFFDWAATKDADVIALQDVRCREYKIADNPAYQLPGFEAYFFEGEDEDYGGTAIYVRETPKAIMRGLANYDLDKNGTLIQADYDQVSIASLWIPPGRDSEGLDLQWHFMETLNAHMGKVRRKRRLFIYAGNFQMAHQQRDLTDPHLHSNTLGFLPAQREWMDELLGPTGYRDALREVSRDDGYHSWWPTHDDLGTKADPGAWRVDYQICSEQLAPKVLTASIYTERRFSDHAPVIVDYDLDL